MIFKVPRNQKELDQLLETIGKNIAIAEELYKELDRIGLGIRKRIGKLEKEIADEAKGVLIFSESHREELTEGEKHKTSVRPSAKLGWRKTPPSVQIKNLKYVVEQLKKKGYLDFVIIRERPDKRMLSRYPEVVKKLKGVKISEGTDIFFIRPRGASTEIVVIGGEAKFQGIRER